MASLEIPVKSLVRLQFLFTQIFVPPACRFRRSLQTRSIGTMAGPITHSICHRDTTVMGYTYDAYYFDIITGLICATDECLFTFSILVMWKASRTIVTSVRSRRHFD